MNDVNCVKLGGSLNMNLDTDEILVELIQDAVQKALNKLFKEKY